MKIGRAEQTAEAWTRHHVLPTWIIPFLARLVGPVEVIMAGTLVVPESRTVGGISATLLLLSYAVYLTLALRNGADGGCACFGTDSAVPINPGHLLRATVLSVVALLSAFDPSTKLQPLVLLIGAAAGVGLMMAGSLVTALFDVSARRNARRV